MSQEFPTSSLEVTQRKHFKTKCLISSFYDVFRLLDETCIQKTSSFNRHGRNFLCRRTMNPWFQVSMMTRIQKTSSVNRHGRNSLCRGTLNMREQQQQKTQNHSHVHLALHDSLFLPLSKDRCQRCRLQSTIVWTTKRRAFSLPLPTVQPSLHPAY